MQKNPHFPKFSLPKTYRFPRLIASVCRRRKGERTLIPLEPLSTKKSSEMSQPKNLNFSNFVNCT